MPVSYSSSLVLAAETPLLPYSDKALLPPSVLEGLLAAFPTLPHPLTFRLSLGPAITHIGVREFTAAEGFIHLSAESQRKLGAVAGTPLTITMVELPKGTRLVAKPLDPTYPITNWKYFLESRLNNAYTLLTQGETLCIDSGTPDTPYELLVELVEPDRTVCIVDTDLSLEVVPMLDLNATVPTPPPTPLRIEPVRVYEETHPAPNTVYLLDLEALRAVDPMSAVVFEGDAVFVGLDPDVGDDCFGWSTLGPSSSLRLNLQDEAVVTAKNLYLAVGSTTPFRVLTAIATQGIPSPSSDPSSPEAPSGSTRCENCLVYVADQSLFLHELNCKKHLIKCECGQAFQKQIPDTHWHCEQCSETGNLPTTLALHIHWRHTPHPCDCTVVFANRLLFARHRALVCPLKLHECRFCHLEVPRGVSTPQDRLQGLTHHESDCGSKTSDCYKCLQPVKQKDMPSHLRIHDMDRVAQARPVKCRNTNCIHTRNLTEYGLCDFCFAPSYSTAHDPDRHKLRARFERRYMIQAMRGCGNTYCKNSECRSSGLAGPLTLTHVQTDLLPRIPFIPGGLPSVEGAWFAFCVDETTTKKKMVVDAIAEELEYDPEWICEAVSSGGTASSTEGEAKTKTWLRANAPTRLE